MKWRSIDRDSGADPKPAPTHDHFAPNPVTLAGKEGTNEGRRVSTERDAPLIHLKQEEAVTVAMDRRPALHQKPD